MKKNVRNRIIVGGIIGVLALVLCLVTVFVNMTNNRNIKLSKVEDINKKASSTNLTASQITNENIGEYIDLGNDPLYEKDTSKNWRILYVEGDTVYVILADYLSNSTRNVTGYTTAAEAAGLETRGSYGMDARYTTNLLKGFNNNTAWLGLANGIDDVIVTATPTAELLMKSYNFKAGTNLDYTSFPILDPTIDEYSLYVPRTETYMEQSGTTRTKCNGYWLDDSSNDKVFNISLEGYIRDIGGGQASDSLGAYYIDYAVRPVVALPNTTEVEHIDDTWKVTGPFTNLMPLTEVADKSIGDYIDLGNDPLGNGDTAKNWRIFYKYDGIVYAILAGYLPNSTGNVEVANLQKNGTYGVKASNAKELLEGLYKESAWHNLTNGINGAKAYGSPSLPEFKSSWDKSYPSNTIQLTYADDDGISRVKPTELGNSKTLYVPKRSIVDGCKGYWVRAKDSEMSSDSYVWAMDYNGVMSGIKTSSSTEHLGIRPIVQLPTNLQATYENNVWTIVGTPYKLEHYKQTDSGYVLAETENLKGAKNTRATAIAKEYAGYTENTNHKDRVASGNISVDGSLVLKLFYDRNSYSVTLETNGGTINNGDITSYTYGVGATLPTDITKEGYVFDGWYEDVACEVNKVTAIGTTEIGNKTYYAKWTSKPKYTVTFINEGVTINTQTVEEGGAAVAPSPAPTKQGHTLSWSVDFSNVTSDLTVNAVWTPNTYTVTLEENGGTINSGDITGYTYGIGATLPTNVTKQWYVFDGWYEDVACEGTRVTNISTTETGDKTYYASWLKDTDGDGTPDIEDTDTQVPYKVEHYTQNTDLTTYTLRETVDKVEGTNTPLTGHLGSTVTAVAKEYTGFTVTVTDETVASGTVVEDGSLTLKLYYNRRNYGVTLNKNEGTINEGNVESYTYGIGATLPTNVTKQWYVFDGWYEDVACEGTRVTNISTTETGDKTYYASWLKDTDGDGTPDNIDTDTQVPYKVEHYTQNTDLTTYTLRETVDKVEGTNTPLTGHLGSTVTAVAKEYTGFTVTVTDETVASGTVVEDGSLTLKLYYNRNQYEVWLQANGGTIENGNVLGYSAIQGYTYRIWYTYGIGVKLPTNITKTGYTFGGWYDNPYLEGNAISEVTATDIGNKEFDAKWNEKGDTQYKVLHYKQTANGYELADTDPLTGKTGANVTAIPKTYEGYKENTQHEGRIASGTIAADGTLELKLYYDILTYKVTFKDGDTVLDEQIVNYGGAATAPTPTKAGYVLRWDEEFNNVKSDLIVNARWLKDTDGDGIPDEEDDETLVKYIVRHYKQQGNTTTYELADTEELQGQLGSQVTAIPKQYEGYVENTTAKERIPSGIIAEDGSLELVLLYDTIKYEVIFKDGDEEVGRVVVPHGGAAEAPVLTKEGYTLSWDIAFNNVKSNLTVNAVWRKVTEEQRNYKVEHYVETKEGNYILKETETLAGDIGDVIIAIPKTYEEYVLDEEHEGTIKEGEIEEGSELVLKLYYKYKRFSIIFKDGGKEVGREEVIYGGTAKPPVLTKPGYILNWDKALYDITSDLTINTVWTKDPNYKDPNSGKDDGKEEEKPSILPKTGEETVTLGATITLLGVAIAYFIKYKF